MLSTNELEKTKATSKASELPLRLGRFPRLSGNSIHKRLVEEMKANLKKGVAANGFQSFSRSLSGFAQEVMTAFYEAIFEGIEKGFAKEVAKKKRYFVAAVAQGEGSQLLLLLAIEEFCGKSNLTAVKEVAMVLQAPYDADVLEEEYILQWYLDGSTGDNKESPVWKNVKPFIEWLQIAKSESEEDSVYYLNCYVLLVQVSVRMLTYHQ